MSFVPPLDTGGESLYSYTFFMNGQAEETVRDLNTAASTYPYRVLGWTEARRLFHVGGRAPFSMFSFTVRFSNLAESCQGPGAVSPELIVTTRRMTVPKGAASPQLVDKTGGSATLRALQPADIGGYPYAPTGAGELWFCAVCCRFVAFLWR